MLEIVVPYDTSRKDVTVYRYHGGKAEALKQATDDAKAGGTFKLGADSVTIYATKFSTYAIGYTPEDGGSSGSGGGNSSGGGGSSGGGSGSFGPNDAISRAQFAQILHNKEGGPAGGSRPQYSDVAAGAWYAGAVRWAASQGVVSGYDNGMFGPDDNITREQLAAMLWRYAGKPPAPDLPLNFTDAGKVSGYAQEALRWAVDQGIIAGKGGGILDPLGSATRAEAAAMLQRFCERET